MRAVQHPELHELERRDLRDHLGADFMPIRAAIREDIFDRPLPERLADDRRGILGADQLRDLGDVGIGRRRHDAVDHGRGEGAIGFDPGGELVVGQRGEIADQASQDMAVRGKVVAAQRGEGAQARIAPRLQAGDEDANGRAWSVGIGEIVDDVGMIGLEAAGRRIVAVALLGDGERDDAGLGRGQLGDEGGGALGRDKHVENRADDVQLRPGRGALQQGVEAVLRLHPVALVGALEACADDAPGTEALLQSILGVFGEMGAGEGAQA